MDVLVLLVYILAALPGLRSLSRRRPGQPRGWLNGVLLSGALILLLILAQGALGIYVDALWFREMGAERRFWTELKARSFTFLFGAVAAFVVLWVNAFVMRRVATHGLSRGPKRGEAEADELGFIDLGGGRWAMTGASPALRLFDRLRLPAVALASLLLGGVFGASWWTFLREAGTCLHRSKQRSRSLERRPF